VVVGDRFGEPGLGLDDVSFFHGLDAKPDRIGVDGVGPVRGAAGSREDPGCHDEQDRHDGQDPASTFR